MPNGDVLDTFVSRLTDAYKKNPESNVYKLAKIAADQIQDNEDLLFTIQDWRDIDQAGGVPLDEIGRDIGQTRGITDDNVFRTLIKAKIKRNLSDGSIETLIDFISFILSCDPSDIYIRERWTEYYNQTLLTNFVGKVSGSTVSNPNTFKHNNGNPSTGLLAPSNAAFSETSGGYASASTLNGVSATISNTNNGAQAQELFSFNLIAIIERKYGITIPGADTAAKVAWLKANVSSLTANWYGYGSGPAGNKAYFYGWNSVGASWSYFAASHTNPTVTKLAGIISNVSIIANMIDANGFIHCLAYADASNGTTASTINTDYVELNVTLPDMKMGGAALYVEAPIGPISQTGLSVKQFGTLLNMVTAAGVRADVLFEGTFEFGALPSGDNGVIDASAGFAPVDQSTGGALGAAYNPDTDFELPL